MSKGNPIATSNHIYVRAMKGYYQKMRHVIGWVFMLLFLLTPWLTYHGRQAILIDLADQKFYFFSVTLWPQDLYFLAIFLVIAAFALFFVTTFFGRVWCGYMCPQTVWTFIFLWFEEKLEGPANKRKQQDSKPLTKLLIIKKTIKHSCWLFVAFITSFTFVGYFIPVNILTLHLFSFSISSWISFWLTFFTLATYFNAGWMRSIVCTHMCPYARFQSAMYDKDTFTVSYHPQRGEPRGPRSRKADPKTLGLGDCIDCNLCVQVCPTGIDIRDGLQYECINCGACVDACDDTMKKMNYPLKLIDYTTIHQIEKQKTRILRPKLLGYGGVTGIMVALFVYLLSTLSPVQFTVIRDRNSLFRYNGEGIIENTFTLKIINKTQFVQTYELSAFGLTPLYWYGPKKVTLEEGEIYTLPLSIGTDPTSLTQTKTRITFSLSYHFDDQIGEKNIENYFIGEVLSSSD